MLTSLLSVLLCLLPLLHANTSVIMKVMTFNVRTSQAAEDAANVCSNWEGTRKSHVLEQIKSLDPDFVGTQETSDIQKKFLDDELGATYTGVGEASSALDGSASEWNRIYHKKAVWSVITSGMFWLGPNPEAASADWGMTYYRTCVWSRFKHIVSGDSICVFNTHWEVSGQEVAQKHAAQIILDKSLKVCDPSDKAFVVMGDFNAKKSYPAMQILFDNKLVDESDEPTFCGDMLSPTCHEKFDFILHRLQPPVCKIASKVVRQAFDNCYPSDHAVQMTSFCISGSCCESSQTLRKPTNKSNSHVGVESDQIGRSSAMKKSEYVSTSSASEKSFFSVGIILCIVGGICLLIGILAILYARKLTRRKNVDVVSMGKVSLISHGTNGNANDLTFKEGKLGSTVVGSGSDISDDIEEADKVPSLVSSHFPSVILESAHMSSLSATSSFAMLEPASVSPNSIASSRYSSGSESRHYRSSTQISFHSEARYSSEWH